MLVLPRVCSAPAAALREHSRQIPSEPSQPPGAARPGRGLAVLPRTGGAAANSVGLTSPALAAPTAGTPAVRSVCSAPARPGFAACDAVVVDTPRAAARSAAAAAALPGGYGPADLGSAYRLPGGTAGPGPTVAIIAAYNDPNAG